MKSRITTQALAMVCLTLAGFSTNAQNSKTIHTIKFTKKAPKNLITLLSKKLKYTDPAPKGVYYSKFDLNDDSVKEYFLYIHEVGWCGSHGCAIEILSKNGTAFKPLLSVISYERIFILKNKTGGYHDITFFPDSEINRPIFRWNGKEYN